VRASSIARRPAARSPGRSNSHRSSLERPRHHVGVVLIEAEAKVRIAADRVENVRPAQRFLDALAVSRRQRSAQTAPLRSCRVAAAQIEPRWPVEVLAPVQASLTAMAHRRPAPRRPRRWTYRSRRAGCATTTRRRPCRSRAEPGFASWRLRRAAEASGPGPRRSARRGWRRARCERVAPVSPVWAASAAVPASAIERCPAARRPRTPAGRAAGPAGCDQAGLGIISSRSRWCAGAALLVAFDRRRDQPGR
jgi:hypothetical protein